MRVRGITTWAILLAVPLSAAAEDSVDRSAAGYCDFVEGTAAAEAAPMVAPELFGNAGLTNAGEATGPAGAPIGSPAPRFTLGIGWKVDGLYKGLLLKTRAAAECRRFQALSELNAALTLGPDIGEAQALEARGRVLTDRLAQLGSRLDELRAEVEAQEASVEELRAFELRVDSLRARLTETEGELGRLAGKPSAPSTPLPELVTRLRLADAEVESTSADLRTSASWELGVRGGYDQLIGSDALPLFGLVTVSWNVGRLWQGEANARARAGREAWVEADVTGAPLQAQRLLRELDALRQASLRRRDDVNSLAQVLSSQLEEVEQLETRVVRRFRDLLLFERARLDAEAAYLERRVELLTGFLGQTP